MSEMAPSHIRGKLGLINFLLTGGGVFSASVSVGLFSIDSQHAYTFGWRFDNHIEQKLWVAMLNTHIIYVATYED